MVAQPGLIVNADDLGIHPRIDAGIFEAFERGILTSATLLVTTPFAAAAAEEARRRDLPLGLHFSLTLGKAMAPAAEVPDLVDRAGNLHLSATRLLLLGSGEGKNRDLYRQIEREIAAQFAAACDLGIALTHVDSHQHVHMNPRIFGLLEAAAERHGLRALRLCRESFYLFELATGLPANLRRLNPAKLALARVVQRPIRPRLQTSDRFFGLMYSGEVTKSAFAQLVTCVARSGGICEIGLHPGRPAPPGEAVYPRPGYNAFISSPSREAELALLIDPSTRAMVLAAGLRLLSYAEL
jgi:chitin disaccharide deacetylase